MKQNDADSPVSPSAAGESVRGYGFGTYDVDVMVEMAKWLDQIRPRSVPHVCIFCGHSVPTLIRPEDGARCLVMHDSKGNLASGESSAFGLPCCGGSFMPLSDPSQSVGLPTNSSAQGQPKQPSIQDVFEVFHQVLKVTEEHGRDEERKRCIEIAQRHKRYSECVDGDRIYRNGYRTATEGIMQKIESGEPA